MRTVAIVGDSRGIGAALREQLLDQGVRVIGVSWTGVQREGGAPNYQSLVLMWWSIRVICLDSRTSWMDWFTVLAPSARCAAKPSSSVTISASTCRAVQRQGQPRPAQSRRRGRGQARCGVVRTVAVQTGMAFREHRGVEGAVEGGADVGRRVGAGHSGQRRGAEFDGHELAASLRQRRQREAAADATLKKVLGAGEVASAAAYLVSEHAADHRPGHAGRCRDGRRAMSAEADMVRWTRADLDAASRKRARTVNSLSGFKSATLVGSSDRRACQFECGEFGGNLVESCPNGHGPSSTGDDAHTYKNLLATASAPSTTLAWTGLPRPTVQRTVSGRRVGRVVGLTPCGVEGTWEAPESEARVRWASPPADMVLPNRCHFMVLDVQWVEVEGAVAEDGYVDLGRAGTTAISGLDTTTTPRTWGGCPMRKWARTWRC